jgi:hypothetical protein
VIVLYPPLHPASNPLPVRAALIICLLFVCACAGPPETDAPLITELVTAIDTTLAAMQVPVEQRPTARVQRDQAGLLAVQVPVKHREQIRHGEVDPADVIAAANNRLAILTRDRPDLTAPTILVWLVDHGPTLDRGQVLLLDCLSEQLAREAQLEPKRKDP